ncbi:YqxA family protein [Brevibacillus humidisoli]|uniref:DUF3679 domain-containing protein n=1 Tax=Brevibacillus humidisoli TaxID=2895522 RepID=UPI001E402681|nr:DUF3679 domain-containing protein [Brevibacillus humidisoli]UFJ38873.1 YqxA family protein [Brevibacillus humidisoli]
MNVTFKFIGMLVILLTGVVIGLQTAEKGLQRVHGQPDAKPQTFYITKVDQGEVEMAVMGTPIKTSPGKMVNYISEVGSALGQIVKDGAKSTFRWLASLFEP